MGLKTCNHTITPNSLALQKLTLLLNLFFIQIELILFPSFQQLYSVKAGGSFASIAFILVLYLK